MYVLFSLVQRGITVLPLFLSLPPPSPPFFSLLYFCHPSLPPLAPVLGRNGMEKCFRTVVECIAEFFSARVYIRGPSIFLPLAAWMKITRVREMERRGGKVAPLVYPVSVEKYFFLFSFVTNLKISFENIYI